MPRIFNISATEVKSTETGDGFKSCSLCITLEDDGTISKVEPGHEGYVENAPNPAKE